MAGYFGHASGHYLFAFPNGDASVARAKLTDHGLDDLTGLGGSALQHITAHTATIAKRCCAVFVDHKIDFRFKWVEPGQPSSPETEASTDSESVASFDTVHGGFSSSGDSDATLHAESSSDESSGTVHGDSSTSGVVSPSASDTPVHDPANLSDSTSDSAVSR